MKFCKDCKHFRPQYWQFLFIKVNIGNELALCAHPSVVSKVDGKPVKFCDIRRKYEECGIEGNDWEPK